MATYRPWHDDENESRDPLPPPGGSNAVSWELDDGGVQFGRPGPYAGRGPLGYQRSDSRIREDVCERLTDAGDVDATSIAVAVEGGVVTLTGTLRDRATRRRAEDIAGEVAGVIDVLNRLRVA